MAFIHLKIKPSSSWKQGVIARPVVPTARGNVCFNPSIASKWVLM